MKYSKVWAWIISILTFGLGILVTMAVIDSKNPTKVMPWAENVVLITSFVISVVAFVFAMITYFSIDAVESVTAMDGNVLENEDYEIAYEEMIDTFKDERNQEAFTKKLFEEVKCPRRTKSCIVFADHLQKILDHIILFTYVKMEDESVKKECNKLVRTIKKEANRYNRLSNGIKYQLDENVKLITCILDYLKMRSEKQYGEASKLENIRGNMIKNPISKILYYDYLGLDYKGKAAKILGVCGKPDAEFGVEHMRIIMKHEYSNEEKKHMSCVVERAGICFVKAQEIAKENILWEGYISYNKVRVEIMKFLMEQGASKEEILSELNRIIRVRENVEYLFKRKDSYLNSQFAEEVRKAKVLKKSFEELIYS